MTLANERVSLSSAGSMWGSGPSAADLLRSRARQRRAHRSRRAAARGGALHRVGGDAPQPAAHAERPTAGAHTGRRGVDPEDHGRRARPARARVRQASRRRRRHADRIRPGRRAVSSCPGGPDREPVRPGRASQFPDVDPVWHYGFLFSPALTIGGGTFADPTQHRRRARARPAARHRCRTRPHVVAESPAAGADRRARQIVRVDGFAVEQRRMSRAPHGAQSRVGDVR